MGITRKLRVVDQAMRSMLNQNNLVDFLDNPENGRWVNGLVEDVHYAWMDYQVCTPKRPTLIGPDIHFRPRYDKTSITRVVKRL